MKTSLLIIAALVGSMPAQAEPAQENAIVRHLRPESSPILSGVTLPQNAQLLMLSGQVPPVIDKSQPADSIAAYGDTRTQTIGALNRVKEQLNRQGYTMSDIVRLTVFLVGDPKLGGRMDFKGFSEGYATFFGTPEQPNLVARSTVQVQGLVNPGLLVEIEATAAKAQ
jgi:enamine deaminase RidA (YjgF/YER057c/UK114 family)